MADHRTTSPAPALRRREALGLVAAFAATLGAGSAAAMESKRPSQPVTVKRTPQQRK